jgi:hypothetical protein
LQVDRTVVTDESDRFYAAVARLGFTAVGVGCGEDVAEASRHGLRIFRDRLVGEGVLEAGRADWSALVSAYRADRHPRCLVRSPCLSDPEVLDELGRTVVEALAATSGATLAAALGDVSVTRQADPFDFCFCEHCLLAYRRLLQSRYGDVHSFNRAFGTDHSELTDVRPWTTDRIRARELGGASLPADLREWALHRELCDQVLAAALAVGLARSRAAAAGVPCGLTGIRPPSAFGGHDHRRIVPQCSFYGVHDIGGARDLAMCLASRDAFHVATIGVPGPGVPAAWTRARFLELIAHGLDGVIVSSCRDVLGGDATPTPFGSELAASFAAARRLDVFAGARIERSPVWLVESQASVRAHWMIDSAADGDAWSQRLTGHEVMHSTSVAARSSWVRLLEDLGLQGRWIAAEELPRALERGGPRALVLPACYALSDDAVSAIERYARGGGTVVADHGAALYDERLLRRPRGALDGIFGLRDRSFAWTDLLVREGRADDLGRLPRGAAAAERGIRGELGEPIGDFHVQIESAVGRGRAVYLNLAVCEYGAARLAPERLPLARELRARIRRVLLAAGVMPPVEVRGDGLPTCIERLRLRARDGRTLLAIRVNALDDAGLFAALCDRGPRSVELIFPAPLRLVDLIRGEQLATSDRFVRLLDPAEPMLFEVRPPG